jgi:hypothetical protein
MTDNIVKQIDECRDYLHENAPGILDRAADRIEILEEALRKIADGVRDADKSYVSLFHELQFEARAALKGKTDDIQNHD